MPAGPGVPFAAVTSTWPTVGKIHRAKGTRGRRIVADCNRSFRDAAKVYPVTDWPGMADEHRCRDCVSKSTLIGE